MDSDKRNMDLSDHELALLHSEQLKTVCKMLAVTNKTLNDYILKIEDRCEARKDFIQETRDANMKTNTFWKILTILVVVLMAMSGVMNYNREVSLKNEIRIKHLTSLTERNGELLEELLKGLISDRRDTQLHDRRKGESDGS